MSGIEKVCEYSEEYPGHIMRQWKRNSIQIMPKFRHNFKNKSFKLFRFLPADPGCTWLIKKNGKLYQQGETDYCLYVPDLPGKVNGFYYNHTYSWKIVRRKLKRLMGCRELKEVRIPLTLSETYDLINYLGLGYSINNFIKSCHKLTKNEWLELIEEINNGNI